MSGGDDPDFPTGEFPRGSHPEGPAGASHEVRPGSLLIASTDLIEPTFSRSIVYMIEHNDSGSLGVILNQMSDVAVHNVLPKWHELAAPARALFIGGPVKQDAALCLGVLKPGVDASLVDGVRPVDGRVVLIDLDTDTEEIAGLIEGVRLFAGYAGWGIGQLGDELSQDSWMVVGSKPVDVLCPPDAELWFEVLRRQPWPTALLATHPIDVIGN